MPPKCHGIHPKVVGYVCPYCGAGKRRQQTKVDWSKVHKLIQSKQVKSSPSMRIIGTPVAK